MLLFVWEPTVQMAPFQRLWAQMGPAWLKEALLGESSISLTKQEQLIAMLFLDWILFLLACHLHAQTHTSRSHPLPSDVAEITVEINFI